MGMPAKKKIVSCTASGCSRKMWRLTVRKNMRCKKCTAFAQARWRKANPEKMIVKWRARYAANKEAMNAARIEYGRKHPEVSRAASRRYRQRLELAAQEVDEAAECACGAAHTEERRLTILKRMLPAGVHEIRDAWSCLWGLPGEQDAGARRLYRDLEKLGTVRDGGTFYLQSARAA